MSTQSNEPVIDGAQVLAFLRQTPNFFQDNPEALLHLTLNHDSGTATSLIEKQVSVLRERNEELHQRLHQLLDNARDNDVLFDKSRRLVLALIEATELGDLIDALLYSLDSDFNVEHCSIVIFDEQLAPAIGPARVFTSKEAGQAFPALSRIAHPKCGQLPDADLSQLFPKMHHQIGSAAVAPLSNGAPMGLLAIANNDPQFYRSSMGTLFLGYIAEVLNRCLPELIERAQSEPT